MISILLQLRTTLPCLPYEKEKCSIFNEIEILQIASHFHDETHYMLREAYITIFSTSFNLAWIIIRWIFLESSRTVFHNSQFVCNLLQFDYSLGAITVSLLYLFLSPFSNLSSFSLSLSLSLSCLSTNNQYSMHAILKRLRRLDTLVVKWLLKFQKYLRTLYTLRIIS